jgi:hypothetical protein
MSSAGYGSSCPKGIKSCKATCIANSSSSTKYVQDCYTICDNNCGGSGASPLPSDDPFAHYDDFCANQGFYVGKVDAQTRAYWNVYCEEKKSMENEAAKLAKQHQDLLNKAAKTDATDLAEEAAKVFAEQVAMIKGIEFVAPKVLTGLMNVTGQTVLYTGRALQYTRQKLFGKTITLGKEFLLQIKDPDELSNSTSVLADSDPPKFSNPGTTTEEGFAKIAGGSKSFGNKGWGWNSYVRKPYLKDVKNTQKFQQAIQEASANRIAKNKKLFDVATRAGSENEGLAADAEIEIDLLKKLDLGKKSMAWFMRDPATFTEEIDDAAAKLADEISDQVIETIADSFLAQAVKFQIVKAALSAVVGSALSYFGMITMVAMIASAVLDSIDPCDLKQSMGASGMLQFTNSYNKSFRQNMLATEGAYVDSFGHVFHTDDWPVRLDATDSGMLQFDGPPGKNVQNYLASRGLPLTAELSLHPNSISEQTGNWNFYTNLHAHFVQLYLHSLDFNARGELIKHPSDPRMYPTIPRTCTKDEDCNYKVEEQDCEIELKPCASHDTDTCTACVDKKTGSGTTTQCTTEEITDFCVSSRAMPFYQTVTLANPSTATASALAQVTQTGVDSGKLAYPLNIKDTELQILLASGEQKDQYISGTIRIDDFEFEVVHVSQSIPPSSYACNQGTNFCQPNVPEAHSAYCSTASLKDFVDNPSCTSASNKPSDFLGFFTKASDAIAEVLMPNNEEISKAVSNLLPIILIGTIVGIYLLFLMIK